MFKAYWPHFVACLVVFVIGVYVGESKRLVVNIQDCVKYRGLDEGMWR